jgi:uncharacterized peroxidase-related enzyme
MPRRVIRTAWIKTQDEHEAEGELRRIYKRIRGSRGKVSNIFKSQSLNPEVLEAHLDLYLRIMFGKGGLSRPQREMIAVTVSAANNCEYCVIHHTAALRTFIPDEGFLAKFVNDYKQLQLGSKEMAMLDYALKLTKRPGAVTEGDLGTLRLAGLGDSEILHLALVVSYFNFVNRLTSGLGVAIEGEGGTGYRY